MIWIVLQRLPELEDNGVTLPWQKEMITSEMRTLSNLIDTISMYINNVPAVLLTELYRGTNQSEVQERDLNHCHIVEIVQIRDNFARALHPG